MESHNHNDIGNFIVYANGHPALVDIGVETYSRKTFSKDRYSIWTMKSSYHNTAIINGCDQLPGYEYRAGGFSFDDNGAEAVFKADMAKAYGESACVSKYERTLLLNRVEKQIVLTDEYRLNCVNGGITLPLISISKPKIEKGRILIPAKDSVLEILFDESVFKAAVEKHDMSDSRLQASWNTDSAYRTLLTQINPLKEGAFSIVMREIR